NKSVAHTSANTSKPVNIKSIVCLFLRCINAFLFENKKSGLACKYKFNYQMRLLYQSMFIMG
ncbi:hypothetical protein, partial [Snodgrassella alvi]|uniref:hypothetical protein n=1 Tax=Snodgrassella alvi TaxID=1196083 RepID=UPI001C53E096